MTGNVPQKRRDLARDRNGCNGGALAFGHEAPVTRAKAHLRLPSNIADLWRQVHLATLMNVAEARGMPVGPGRLDQGFARADVACPGDPPP